MHPVDVATRKMKEDPHGKGAIDIGVDFLTNGMQPMTLTNKQMAKYCGLTKITKKDVDAVNIILKETGVMSITKDGKNWKVS